MNNQAACKTQTEIANVTVKKLSFAEIPHQTKLFLDYLKNPQELENFYPSAVSSINELNKGVTEIISKYKTNRDELADALNAMNKSWNASEQTLSNIEKLRQKDCVAVVTGQQAGLFTGSLYTIYKAFSTIKTARCLQNQGINAVPIFWIASEDHDFAEVAKTYIINRDNGLSEIKIETTSENEGLPVGKIKLDETIVNAIEKLFESLPQTEFSAELKTLVNDCYKTGFSMSEAFAKMMTRLFGEFGLILLEPLDEKLKVLVAPIYAEAVEKSREITNALFARSKELSENYHAQILVEKDSFPLFWLDENGARKTLKFNADKSKVSVQKSKTQFTLEELQQTANETPSRLSPNATLRATVQDYLLPTIAYYGGAAEIAYFAQTAEVYKKLNRYVTTILPRSSVTIIEAQTGKVFEKYGLRLQDFFEKPETLSARIIEKYVANKTASTFDQTEKNINIQLETLKNDLSQIDSTLAVALTNRSRKINYHINAMRLKFHRAELKKNEVLQHRLNNAFAMLYPHKGLQERTINITSFLSRHGLNLMQWIFQVLDSETREHQIIYL